MDEHASFTAMYERERNRVCAYLWRCTHDWPSVEDLCAEVFLLAFVEKTWLHREEYEAQGIPYSHWLKKIARYRYLDWIKTQRKLTTFSSAFPNAEELDIVAEEGWVDAIIDACDTNMAVALLRALLKDCTNEQLQLIELRYTQNVPAYEVAAQLGLTMSQYANLHRRLVEQLAMRINPQEKKPYQRPPCRVEGCSLEAVGRGLCSKHYYEWEHKGIAHPALPRKSDLGCSIEGCNEKHASLGLCLKHYSQHKEQRRMQRRRDAVNALL